MPRRTSRGRCSFCGRSFGKGAMARHLRTCKERAAVAAAAGPAAASFHLVVEGREQPEYWLHLEVPARLELQLLDDFLRDLWLECCGHLSCFTIDDIRYEAVLDEEWSDPEDRGMEDALGRRLYDGLRFYHEYDYGSTTELVLRVVGVGESAGGDIQLLARNDPPDLRCRTCGGPAVKVALDVWWPEEGMLCAACAAKEVTEEGLLLPVVNSPRTGVCCYDGPMAHRVVSATDA